jgi:uncharacterized protein (TIGR00375 family)
MIFYADFHVHSRFSRATSKTLDLSQLYLWGRRKGLSLIGTGDFTHPAWLAELREELVPDGCGLFDLKDTITEEIHEWVPVGNSSSPKFILTVEIANIYKKGERVRKVHNLVFVPDFDTADRLIDRLSSIGNVKSDGRPILGLDSRDLLEIVLEISPSAYLIPAHIWTPWFSVLGSKSGFESIEECFDDLAEHIFAVETGLSSDPLMNWRLSSLDKFTLVSNSDAHSPAKLAREANIFDTGLDYDSIKNALDKNGSRGSNHFLGTIEFFPEEGKYHFDGHRKCHTPLSPQQTAGCDGICPVCGKPVVIGVLNRVATLADMPEGRRPSGSPRYHKIVPLHEILAEIHGVGTGSKKVAREYCAILNRLGSELQILLNSPIEEISLYDPLLGEAVKRIREGEVHIAEGYDGQYGTIRVFDQGEKEEFLSQRTFIEDFVFPAGDSLDRVSRPRSEVGAIQKKTGSHEEVVREEGTHNGKRRRGGDSAESEKCIGDRKIAEGQLHFYSERAVEMEEGRRGDRILKNLNPVQKEIVSRRKGPILVVAGPGTGKTRTLTHRIARLLLNEYVSPRKVLAITFTNRAAREMRERLYGLLENDDVSAEIRVRTFHSFALDLLRSEYSSAGIDENFRIVDEAEQEALFRTILPTVSRRKRNETRQRISRAKQRGLIDDQGRRLDGDPEHLFEGDRELFDVYRKYKDELLKLNALDFDDLIALSVHVLEHNPQLLVKYRDECRSISVDEYQDINYLQYRLIRLLAPRGENLLVIGDPDQAIYGFRGSDVRYFLRFREDYPMSRTFVLRENYRSTMHILNSAHGVIEGTTEAGGDIEDRTLLPVTNEALRIHIHQLASERAEAEYIVHTIERMMGGISYFSIDSGRLDGDDLVQLESFNQFAVLYRTARFLPPVKEAFDRLGIPYQVVGSTPFLGRKDVRPVLAILRLFTRSEQLECEALHRELRTLLPQGHIPEKDVEKFNELKERSHGMTVIDVVDTIFEENLFQIIGGSGGVVPDEKQKIRTKICNLARPFGRSILEFCRYAALESGHDEYDPRAKAVTLSTLHSSKGLEFSVVFIIGCEENVIPYRKEVWAHDHLEKARQEEGGAPSGEPMKFVERDAEECRLFYVGMTRTRRCLYLLHTRTRQVFGKRVSMNPSPFLKNISGDDAVRSESERRITRTARAKREKRNQLELF